METLKKIIISMVLFVVYGYYVSRSKLDLPKNTNPLFLNAESTSTNLNNSYIVHDSFTYNDGEYLGKVVDALYGQVQVKVDISGGKIENIEFLKYPDHHSYSRQINPEATSILTTEALEIQSAEVDIVTGATQTSKGFIESLQSALDEAKS